MSLSASLKIVRGTCRRRETSLHLFLSAYPVRGRDWARAYPGCQGTSRRGLSQVFCLCPVGRRSLLWNWRKIFASSWTKAPFSPLLNSLCLLFLDKGSSQVAAHVIYSKLFIGLIMYFYNISLMMLKTTSDTPRMCDTTFLKSILVKKRSPLKVKNN